MCIPIYIYIYIHILTASQVLRVLVGALVAAPEVRCEVPGLNII